MAARRKLELSSSPAGKRSQQHRTPKADTSLSPSKSHPHLTPKDISLSPSKSLDTIPSATISALITSLSPGAYKRKERSTPIAHAVIAKHKFRRLARPKNFPIWKLFCMRPIVSRHVNIICKLVYAFYKYRLWPTCVAWLQRIQDICNLRGWAKNGMHAKAAYYSQAQP